MGEYNTLVDSYNSTKHLYCPELIKLKDAKPVLPSDPEFHCQQIAKLCSHYAAYTLLLQKLFDPTVFSSDVPNDTFTKGADCLKNKIAQHIIP